MRVLLIIKGKYNVGKIKLHVYDGYEEGHSKAFRGSMFEKVITAKKFLTKIKQRFVKNKKGKTCTLLINLILMRCTGKDNIRDYIMKMSHLSFKLIVLKLELFGLASSSNFNIFINTVY